MTEISGQRSEVSSQKSGFSKGLTLSPWLFALSTVGVLLLVLCVPAHAQQLGKVYRIGYLAPGSVDESFRQGLRELGYIEGKNLTIEYRQAETPKHFPDLAAELVHLKVDCILAVGIGAIRAARQATDTIPIVMGNASDDPVRHGLVASLARPGGNITGMIDMLPDLAGKRLALLKETFPKISRFGHFVQLGTTPGGPVETHFKETEIAARALGIQVQSLEVTGPDGLEDAFRAAAKARAEALIVVGVSFFIPHLQRIVKLQLKHRLPAMHTHASWVPPGGLMAYTTDAAARNRRAAAYVDRVLKGAKPADLPVERPTKFELVINLKTANQIGVTMPQWVLMRADRVIR
jgi:putative tryptophan/tyrosine transport system substrate-binding protein